jgi:superfamily I DNA/RNA helicase
MQAGANRERATDSVKLVTFHSSKGFEYPVVAIPGFGFLPDARELEQHELRLAYVAMTRATDRLIMTCHRITPFVKRLRKAGALWHEPRRLANATSDARWWRFW